MIRHIAITGTALIALALALLIFVLPQPADEESAIRSEHGDSALYITDLKILQDGAIKSGMTVKIENGIISEVSNIVSLPSGAHTLDGSGLTALPGLIDAHTHSYGSALSDALQFGIGINLDMFSSLTDLPGAKATRESVDKQKQADLFSAGMMATAPGGHGTQYGVPIETLTGPEGAQDWVMERKAEGSDFIKLVYMPYQSRIPSLDRATAKAVIAAAHAEDLMALAHISTQQAAQDIIEDDIDGLVHIFADKVASPELIQLAVDKDVFIIPTLAVIASVDGQSRGLMDKQSDGSKSRLSPMQRQTLSQNFPGGAPGYSFETALKNAKLFHEAGVDILAGSDAPNPGTAHGISLHLEMQHLVKAGFSPMEALNAASIKPAQRFDLNGRGTLAPGARADLLLVSGEPYTRINDTLNIAHIIKNGFPLDSVDKAASSEKAFKGERLSDFENGLTLGADMSWTPTDDSMANGLSEAEIVLDGNSLKVSGEAKAGFPYPWAGASISVPFNGKGQDISRFKQVQFYAKGTAGTYRLMAFNEGAPGIPPSQNFEISTDWQTITLELDGFNGFEPGVFTGFAFVAGPEPGKFEFFLRDVSFQP